MNQIQQGSLKFVKIPFANEGTKSPFIARLFIGILDLANSLFSNTETHKKFDKSYNTILHDLFEVRKTMTSIINLWETHISKISKKELAEIEINGSIRIHEDIYPLLKKEVESFLNSIIRILKDQMQDFTKIFGIEIGFLYQKDKKFMEKLKDMENIEPNLAFYLNHSRNTWTTSLIKIRNDLDHEGWRLPRPHYFEYMGNIYAEEPKILDQPLSTFLKFMLDRLLCFVEEVSVYCIRKKILNSFMIITEIPIHLREPKKPIRFRLDLKRENNKEWQINYTATLFEEK